MTIRTVDFPDGSEHRPDSIGVFFVMCIIVRDFLVAAVSLVSARK